MTYTLHPSMSTVDGVALLAALDPGDGIEVTGLATYADVQTIQSWADAARIDIRWRHRRNGSTALIEVVA